MKLLLTLSLAAFGCACGRPQSPWEKVGVRVVDGKPQLDEVEIGLERTACYGWCPAYRLKLSGDGTMTYTGISYVKTRAEHTAALDREKLLPLLERCTELDLLSHEHRCYVGSVDNSHAFVTLRIGPRAQRVKDSLVQRDELPFQPSANEVTWHHNMFDLEEAIDAFVNIESWIGTQAEREAHREDWR